MRRWVITWAATLVLGLVGVPGAAVAHAGLNAPCDYAISGPEVVQVDGAAQVSVSVEPVSCGWPAESRRSIACVQELGAGLPTTCVPADGAATARVLEPLRPGAVYVGTGRGCGAYVGFAEASPECQLLGPVQATL